MTKALFVGLDNPQSQDPRYALFPYPPGCAGHRLLSMMQEADPAVTRQSYVNIPKINLLPIATVSSGKRRWLDSAAFLLVEQALHSEYSHVVLFGNEVRDSVFLALGCEPPVELTFVPAPLVEPSPLFAWVPHPSGRNRWYNTRGRTKRVGKFLINAVKGDV